MIPLKQALSLVLLIIANELKGEHDMCDKIKAAMKSIEEQIPLSYEFAEDARYMWPERWRQLRTAIEAALEPQGDIDDDHEMDM